MLCEWRARARAAVGPEALLKLDRGPALFITSSPACPPGFRQQPRGALFALTPETGFPPATEDLWVALLKQTAHPDSRYPTLVKAARQRMALCLRTRETDPGLAALQSLMEDIEKNKEV